MAIATQKIKEMLDAQRDEALKELHALVGLLADAGQEGLNRLWDTILVSKAKVDPLMTSLDTLKSVLAMDNGAEVKAEPSRPTLTPTGAPRMPAYEPAQSSIRKLSAEGQEVSHILTSGPVHDAA